ncbi:MAG TPA: hypothetical protein VF835_01170 [Rhizomicrobium sp.]
MAKSETENRRERLAAALRENLKRRKAHKRSEPAKPAKSASDAHAEGPGSDTLSRPKPAR